MKTARLNHVQNWPELACQAKWSAIALAKLCRVSPRSLHRHFLKYQGKNTKSWLAEQRLRQALNLLQDGLSVKETALCVGYRHPGNLARQYKKQWGICPSQIDAYSVTHDWLQMIDNVRK